MLGARMFLPVLVVFVVVLPSRIQIGWQPGSLTYAQNWTLWQTSDVLGHVCECGARDTVDTHDIGRLSRRSLPNLRISS